MAEIVPPYIKPPGLIVPKPGYKPVFPSETKARINVTARLLSLDTGLTVMFSSVNYFAVPHKVQRQGGARWNEAGIAQASPQRLEYQQTNPDVWTISFLMDAYNHPGGVANDFEADLQNLFELKNRVPGLKRAHKCMYVHGKMLFRCILEDIQAPIEIFSLSGGPLQAYEATIVLKQIPR